MAIFIYGYDQIFHGNQSPTFKVYLSNNIRIQTKSRVINVNFIAAKLTYYYKAFSKVTFAPSNYRRKVRVLLNTKIDHHHHRIVHLMILTVVVMVLL